MTLAPAARTPTRIPDGARILRVAIVAPPYFAIPPAGYGGVESVVADLVDALVDRGHQITLVAAGPPGTRAQVYLRAWDWPQHARLGEILPEVEYAARVVEVLRGRSVDVVHDHTLAGPLLAGGRDAPTVLTVHGPATGEPGSYYRALGSSVGLVAISSSQRASAPNLAWVATVHNALRPETFPFRRDKQEYVLFLGRFCPEKAPHLAIDAARRAGIAVVLAGKCNEPPERAYFDQFISPRLGADVTVYGEADASAKRDLLAGARALVNPVCWEEPFGMVMIEAMACGTPVVALRRGSVPEVVRHGVTGVVVDEPWELADAINVASELDPHDCRNHVLSNFSAAAMAAAYERCYFSVIARGQAQPSNHVRTELSNG